MYKVLLPDEVGEFVLRQLRTEFHKTRLTSNFSVDPEYFAELLKYIDLLKEENKRLKNVQA